MKGLESGVSIASGLDRSCCMSGITVSKSCYVAVN